MLLSKTWFLYLRYNFLIELHFCSFLSIVVCLFRLRSASIILEESIEILSFEPENTVEGYKLKIAKDFRIYLGNIVSSIKEYERKQELQNKKAEEEKVFY